MLTLQLSHHGYAAPQQKFAAQTHYSDPNVGSGCLADEQPIKITGIAGDLCSPPCAGAGTCPTDKPSGVTAAPQCALKSSTGAQYCALICDPTADDAQCGANASCKAIQSTGICTYDDVPVPPSSPHWVPISSPTFEMQTVCMSVGFEKDGVTGWAGGGTNGVGAQIIKTEDSGKTWKPVFGQDPTHPAFNIFLATAVKDAKSSVVSGVLFQTYTTDGNTFNASTNGVLSAAQDAAVLPNGSFALVTQSASGENGVALSDDGKTWSFSDIGLDPDKYLTRYGAFPSNDVWYVTAGSWPEQEEEEAAAARHLTSRVSVSADGKLRVRPTAARNDDTGYYAAIAKSTDGGKTFTTVYQKEDAGVYPNGIHCSSEVHCVATLEGETTHIMVTTDGGATWVKTMDDPDPKASLVAVHMVDEKEGWVSGGHMTYDDFEGRYWHTLDGGKTWAKEAIKGLYMFSFDLVSKTAGYSVALTMQSGVQLLKYRTNSTVTTTTLV